MRDFPWWKVPGFVLAQFLGAFCAAGVIYGNYLGAIDIFEGGGSIRTVTGSTSTASLFATYPVGALVAFAVQASIYHAL
jgi:aquaglyceroporin related protein, other eukaryote